VKPLAITAHYDDMEISAGGTMTRYRGTSLVLKAREGAATHSEAVQAAEALLVQRILAPYASEREIVDALSNKPYDTIITCSPWDSHPDHKYAASMAQQVARKAGMNLLYMDTAIPGGVDGTAPKPNLFVTIQPSKYDALECYVSQVEKYGPMWINAVRARDQLYGFQHGVPLAEGFVVADWLL